MFKKEKVIEKYYYNVLHPKIDFDYEKLAKEMVKAQQEAEEQKEIERQKAEEKQREEIIKKRLENLKCAEDFDEEGNPKNRKAKIKLLKNFIDAKESALKDIKVIDSSINSIVAFFFAVIEWLFYLIAIVLLLFFFYSIYQFVDNCVHEILNFSYLLYAIDYILYALILFMFSRIIIRTLKIDCKYNKDSHYMMNFLSVIISIIALIVAVVVLFTDNNLEILQVLNEIKDFLINKQG